MADYAEKFTLAANVPVPINSPGVCVGYDFINDSPFDLNVSWASGLAVELVVPPHTIWRGARPAERLLISGNKWSGRIAVTPTLPQGGAQPGAAPALQLTVLGYVQGNVPAEQVQPMNRLANIGNQISAGQIYNAILELFDFIEISAPPVTQSFSITPTRLNLSGVSKETPGYLLLDYLYATLGYAVHLNVRQGNRESKSKTFSASVPNGGSTLDFQLPESCAITALAFSGSSTASANFGVGSISIDQNDGNFQPIYIYDNATQAGATIAPPGKILFLTQMFGAAGLEGYTNFFTSGGMRARITFNNSTGATQTCTVWLFGYALGFDEANFAIQYVDWQANVYDLGFVVAGEFTLLPLNMLIPVPITDPGQTDFGSLQFVVQAHHSFYNTTYPVGIIIPCAITFLAP